MTNALIPGLKVTYNLPSGTLHPGKETKSTGFSKRKTDEFHMCGTGNIFSIKRRQVTPGDCSHEIWFLHFARLLVPTHEANPLQYFICVQITWRNVTQLYPSFWNQDAEFLRSLGFIARLQSVVMMDDSQASTTSPLALYCLEYSSAILLWLALFLGGVLDLLVLAWTRMSFILVVTHNEPSAALTLSNVELIPQTTRPCR